MIMMMITIEIENEMREEAPVGGGMDMDDEEVEGPGPGPGRDQEATVVHGVEVEVKAQRMIAVVDQVQVVVVVIIIGQSQVALEEGGNEIETEIENAIHRQRHQAEGAVAIDMRGGVIGKEIEMGIGNIARVLGGTEKEIVEAPVAEGEIMIIQVV